MCVVSYIGDDYNRKFKERYPDMTFPYPSTPWTPWAPAISREEFEDLKREVAALKELLLAAKKYDEATGQPDCEMDEKVAFIKKLGEMLGIDMTEVFGQKGSTAP